MVVQKLELADAIHDADRFVSSQPACSSSILMTGSSFPPSFSLLSCKFLLVCLGYALTSDTPCWVKQSRGSTLLSVYSLPARSVSFHRLRKPKLIRQSVAIFLTADILSLVLQAIGGGWAASVTPSPDAASNLMLAGIAFQLGVMIIFVFIGLDFCFRIWKNKPYVSRINKLGNTNSNIEMGAKDNESRRTSETHLKGTGAGAGVGVNGENWTGMSRGWWLFMFAMLISSIAIIIRGKS